MIRHECVYILQRVTLGFKGYVTPAFTTTLSKPFHYIKFIMNVCTCMRLSLPYNVLVLTGHYTAFVKENVNFYFKM